MRFGEYLSDEPSLRSSTFVRRQSMISGLHLLEIGIAIAIFGGLLYWAFVAVPRAKAQRREELRARREAHQAWDPDSSNR